MNDYHIELEIDAIGLICPLPVLKLRRALSKIQPGQMILVRTTDRSATRDITAFCATTGNKIVSVITHEKITEFVIRRECSET